MLHGIVVGLHMKRGAIVDIAPLDATYHPRVHPHVYADVPGLLLMASIESDGARDEVGAAVMIETERGWSVSLRCL